MAFPMVPLPPIHYQGHNQIQFGHWSGETDTGASIIKVESMFSLDCLLAVVTKKGLLIESRLYACPKTCYPRLSLNIFITDDPTNPTKSLWLCICSPTQYSPWLQRVCPSYPPSFQPPSHLRAAEMVKRCLFRLRSWMAAYVQ